MFIFAKNEVFRVMKLQIGFFELGQYIREIVLDVSAGLRRNRFMRKANRKLMSAAVLCVFLSLLATATAGCSFDVSGINTTTSEVCGNGVVDGDEECDGEDMNGLTCLDLGFMGGTLSCNFDCSYDTTGCTSNRCGDGIIDDNEECDGDDLGGMTCVYLGYAGGELGCLATCVFDRSMCEIGEDCGNGLLDPGEECDDGGESESCNADCTFAECGDGVLNTTAGEECDDGGETQTCNVDCTLSECGDGVLNTVAGEECDDGGESATCDGDCTAVWCGDGYLNTTAGEVCDGVDLNGETCETLGFYGGVLGCGTQCLIFDTSGCSGECGDGVKNGDELCDGGDLGGETCSNHGFYGGSLHCLSSCDGFDFADCIETPELLITEISLGYVDGVELLNNSSTTVDLDGWVLEWWGYDNNNDAVSGVVVLPSFVLAPGERVFVADEYPGSGEEPEVIEGEIQSHRNFWWYDVPGAAALSDPNMNAVDFVRWGGVDFEPPPGHFWADNPDVLRSFSYGKWTWGRVPETVDNNEAGDFCLIYSSLGAPNGSCVVFPEKGAVLINEIEVEGEGIIDRIELFNPGTNPVNLNTMVLHIYSDFSGGEYAWYYLPAFVIPGGGYGVIVDDGNQYYAYESGGQVRVPNINWSDSTAGGCWLDTPLGGIDFVRWGDFLATPRSPDQWSDNPASLGLITGGYMGRNPNVAGDNDEAGDWCLAPGTIGAPNATCDP